MEDKLNQDLLSLDATGKGFDDYLEPALSILGWDLEPLYREGGESYVFQARFGSKTCALTVKMNPISRVIKGSRAWT